MSSFRKAIWTSCLAIGAATVGIPSLTDSSSSALLPYSPHLASSLRQGSKRQKPSDATPHIQLDIEQHLLGAGAFGLVKRATNPLTQKQVAVKLILRDNPKIEHEIDVLNLVNQRGGHPNIVEFYGLAKLPAQEARKHIGLVFELFQGGELYDHLVANGAYSEAKASLIIQQLASALEFLHRNGICHGDVKPENVLLRNPGDDCIHAALCDFGSANVVNAQGKCELENNDPVGTVGYSAPEMLCRFSKTSPCERITNATTAVDIFSLGTMLYIILSGEFPFDRDNELKTEEEIAGQILKCDFDFDPQLNPVWAQVSDDAKSLIRQMMKCNPEDRITAAGILQHNWVTQPQRSQVIEGSDVRLACFLKAQKLLRDHFFRIILTNSIRNGLRNRNVKSVADSDMQSYLQTLVESFDEEHKGYLDSSDFKSKLEGNYTKEEDQAEYKFFYSNLNNLLGCGQRVVYKPNEIVFFEGDVADAFYFVDSGSVNVTWLEGETETEIGIGEFFGEMSLMRGERRLGTVVAGSRGAQLIRFSKEEFDSFIVGGSEETRKLMADAASLRMILHASSVFQRLFEDRPNVHLAKGEVLLRRGDVSDAMYFISKGVVDVVDANGDVVAHRKAGETVGELGLVAGLPRSMTIVCNSDTGCDFKRLVTEDLKRLLETKR